MDSSGIAGLPMLVIGLTGGIATGKSTVAGILERLGAVIFDADRIAHDTLSPGEPAHRAVVEAFGKEIVRPDGSIDRSKLGEIVFRNAASRALLEGIVHPEVVTRLAGEVGRLRNDPAYRNAVVVLEIPLLFEAHLEWMVDKTLLVSAEQKEQVRRLTSMRRLPVEEALRRIGAQMPVSEKKQRADWVIENTGSREATEGQVLALWPVLCRLAAQGDP